MRKIPKAQNHKFNKKLKMSKIPEPKFSNQAQTSPDSPFPSKKDRNLLDLIAAKRKPHDLNAITIPTFPHKPNTATTHYKERKL